MHSPASRMQPRSLMRAPASVLMSFATTTHHLQHKAESQELAEVAGEMYLKRMRPNIDQVSETVRKTNEKYVQGSIARPPSESGRPF